MSNTRLHKIASNPSSFKTTRRKLYLAMLAASQFMVAGQVLAAPEGGQVVGGAGSIDQAGSKTTIHQETERMAIDWKSFDVKADERVQFIQPKSTSVALNRVLSNKGSEILGRIDANGKVILVNPNGVVFGKDSQINVGGLIASGLSMNPDDFMNGEFTLTSIEGTEGKVINSGIINAATGGSVTLLGKEVKNEGLISAHLGSVNLAAGKAAVVTFDASGLVGVKITQAVLQNDLGLDAAVINSGEINAQGGKILLTASVSQDIFSQAVNNGGMNQTNSVVMNADGTFTLGAGANVINSGTISTSNTNGDAGQIVLLGNNITNSGNILADTATGTAGHIELNSTDTTSLTQTAIISAQAQASGVGGDIKILGNKVGLFDTASVNASGTNGGGQILIGGDQTGHNENIRNADFIYLGENSNVKTDALLNGDGGKLITFASDTARIYGSLSARGGSEGGNGGFIETSGLKGFEILNAPDIGANIGNAGSWLIDPYNIEILDIGGSSDSKIPLGGSGLNKTFTASGNSAQLDVDLLSAALISGTTVTVSTGTTSGIPVQSGDIKLSNPLTYSNGTLILNAANDININESITRFSGGGKLNISLIADSDSSGGGNITIKSGKKIETQGGYFYAGVRAATGVGSTNGFLTDDLDNPKGVNFTSYKTSDSTFATIDTTGDVGGGDIFINVTGDVTLGEVKFSHGINDDGVGAKTSDLIRLGSVTINAANVTLAKELDFNNSGERTRSGIHTLAAGVTGEDTFLKIVATNNIIIDRPIYDGYGDARDAFNIDLDASNKIDINASVYTSGGNFVAKTNNFKSFGTYVFDPIKNVQSAIAIDAENANDGTLGAGHQKAADWSNGGNITINASSSVNLGAVITDRIAVYHQGQPEAHSYQANVQGNLIVQGINSTDNVSITQSTTLGQYLDVFGSATFDGGTGTGTGNITLLNTGNDFSGNVSIITTGTASLIDINAIKFDASNITGAFTLVAGGDITQVASTAFIVGGVTSLTATNHNVTLANITNDFGIVSFGSTISTLSLKDANALTVNNVTSSSGAIDITALSNALTLNALTTNGTVGTITLAASGIGGNIALNGNISATNTAGNGFKIDVKNNATIGANVLVGSTGTSARGDINFGGTVNSFDSTPRNLSLTGKTITFGGNVGATKSLGIFAIDSTANLSALTRSFYATSFNATATGFSAALINTAGANNVNGGAVVVGAGSAGTVNITAIDTHGGTATTDGKTGGTVTVTGNNITLGTINTAGSDANNIATDNGGIAGAVSITASGTTPIINMNGNVTTIGGAGLVAGLTEIANVNLSTAGTVNLGYSDFFTSNINLVGSTGTDTLNNVNIGSRWDVTDPNKGTITKVADTTKIIAFDKFENLVGGTAADSFIIGTTGTATSINGGTGANKLTGRDAANTWNITGTNSGNLTNVASFSNIQTLQGGSAADIFNINVAFAGAISGGAGADAFNINAAAGNLFGEDGDDSFIVGSSGTATAIDGGNGTNKLTGRDAANTWNITAADAGNVTNVTAFSKIQTLQGGSAADIFNINFSFAGTINGGASADTFNINATTNALSGEDGDDNFVFSSASNAGSATSIDGGAGINTLTGRAIANTWNVTGINIGNLSYVTGFTNIQKLVGGTAADDFIFANDASVVNMDGGAGFNTIDLSNINNLSSGNPLTVTLGSVTIFGMTNISKIIGNDSNFLTLAATSGTNTWNIFDIDNDAASAVISDGINDGTFNNVTVGTMQFVNIKNLTGGSGNDTFNFSATNSGSITGIINGGVGSNTLIARNTTNTWNTTAANSGNLGVTSGALYVTSFINIQNLQGGSFADIFNINANIGNIFGNGGDDNFIFSSVGNAGSATVVDGGIGSNTIVSRDAINTWNITGTNAGNLGDSGGTYVTNFTSIQNLQGGSLADIFNLNADISGTITAGAGANIFNIKTAMGSLQGGSDNDSFIFSASGSATAVDGGAGNNTLTGRDVASTWNLTATNTGNLNVTGGAVYVTNFSNIQNLQGGSLADIFNLNFNVTGTINAGAGANIFNINTPVGSLLGGSDGDNFIFTVSGSAIAIDGGTGNNTLTGRNAINTWNITGTNAGNLGDSGGTYVTNFTSIQNLQGGSLADTFNINFGITGTINSGAGANIFNINTTVGSLLGGSDDDGFIFGVSGTATAIDGGSGNNTLTGRNTINNWNITGTNAGNLNDGGGTYLTNFSNIQNLQGSALADIFNLNFNITGAINAGAGANIFNINTAVGSLSGGINDDSFIFGASGSATAIDGGSGTNTLTARNTTNTWNITGANAGNLGDKGGTYVTNFSNIQNLQGGSLADIFNLNFGVTGTINAGAGANIFNINTAVGNLLGGSDGDNFIFGASGSAGAIDGGAGNNTLTGRDAVNSTWNITAANAGNVSVTGGALYVTNFSNIQNLQGGSLADIFNLNFGVAGTINAGAGANIFNINTTVGSLSGGINDDNFIFGASGSATAIDGGSGINTLTARNTTNTWNINGTNAGNLIDSGGTYVTNFNNIQNLQGGSLADSFIFGSSGSATSLDGGAGVNSLTGRNTNNTWQLSATANSTLTDTGGLYASFANIQTLNGNAGIDTLVGYNQPNGWNITGSNSGTITSSALVINFTGMENLTGNAAADTFVFANNTANITGLIDGGTSIDASGVIDTLDLQNLTSAVTVELGDSVNPTSNPNLNVKNVETITANAGVLNTLIGASNVDPAVGYSWVINANDTGKVSRVGNADIELSTAFVHFGNLTGGTNSDAFEVNAKVSGSIYGGDGAGIDSIDYSKTIGLVEITLGGDGSFGGTGIGGIEGIKGNNDGSSGALFNSSIGIKNGTNNWTIGAFGAADGVNDGQITIAAKTISFENFNIINGGTDNDTFTLAASGQLIGTINAGGGSNNVFNASASAVKQIISLNGSTPQATNLIGFNSITGSTLASSELIGADTSNIWTVNTLTTATKASGNVNGITFSTFSNLTGSASSNDVVDLTGVNHDISIGLGATAIADIIIKNIEQVKANTTKNNTLLADNAIPNTWDINGSNQGSLNALSFTGFANLTGGALADSFKFANNTANITGSIDAGAGADTLDLLSVGRAVNVHLLNPTANVIVSNINVANIETINASSSFVNTLAASDFLNSWNINATNSGDLNKSATSAGVTFTNFNNLVGGNQNDTFAFVTTGKITGYVDGKDHTTGDTVDLSALSNVDILLSSTSDGYRNIERYVGNNSNSILRADNTDNTWVLSGTQNSGMINTTTTFVGFTTLYGGSGKDVFNVTGDSVSGSINGGLGDDSLVLNILSGTAGHVNFAGGGDTNTVTVTGGGTGYSATHTPTGNASGKLGYSNADNITYTVLYSDITTINDNFLADKLTLKDTQNADVFTFKNNGYSLINSPAIFYSNKNNLVVAATDSHDQVIIDGNINVLNELAIRNATVTATANGSVNANSLSLNGTANVGSLDNRLNTDIAHLSISAANGDIYLQVPNSIKIAEFSTNGLFDLTLGGNLTSDVKLTSNQNFSVVTTGDITLEDKTNSLNGVLHLVARDILLNNGSVTNLKGVTAQSLLVDSNGAINANDGAVVVTGTATFTSGTSSDINLNNAGNNFSSVILTSGNDINITDLNNITFTGIAAAGNLVSNSLGVTSGDIKAANVTLNAGTGVADFNNISATSAINVNAQGINANGALTASSIDLNGTTGNIILNGVLDTAGKQTVSVEGKTITQNAKISSGGLSSLHASENLIQNADIESGADISVIADRNLTMNAGKTSKGAKIEYTAGGAMSLLGTISATNDIKATATNDISMGASAASNSTNGNINYSGANIALAGLAAANGKVVLSSTGAITDTNGSAVNVTAMRFVADAVTGIGATDALESAVAELSLSNSQLHSAIDIQNTGSVKIDRLRANGDITLNNLAGDIVLDNSKGPRFTGQFPVGVTDPNVTDALKTFGTVNSNYVVGTLTIDVPNGKLTALGTAERINPDITANIFNFHSGDFGQAGRPLVVYVQDTLIINKVGFSWHPYYGFGVAPKVDNSTYKGNISDIIGAGAEQLVQVETLAEVNPAIFTGVRNYVYDDIAILMPTDQRYDDKDSEE